MTSPASVPPSSDLLPSVPLLIRFERQVEDEMRPLLLARLQEKISSFDSQLAGKAPLCPSCRHPMKSRGRRDSSFLTRFGHLRLRPAVYRCKPCQTSARPLLDALGVEVGRVSGSLARLLALLGVIVPYPLAARLVFCFFGLKVSPMTVWRLVQRLGEACERQSASFSPDPGELSSPTQEGATAPPVVLVGLDGCSLGMQVRQRRRRRRGKEALPKLSPVEQGHFREVKTAVMLRPQARIEPSPGRRQLVRRVLVSCLGHADELFTRVRAKLHELGWLGEKTTVAVLGDGAEWLWRRARQFPRRVEILDFWHALEKAWEFARLSYGEQSKQAARFIARLSKQLKEGQVDAVVRRLLKLSPRGAEAKKKLEELICYYVKNEGRMRYDEYLKKGYGIGSGAVESAHKQVVHARMRQAGMRWSEAGARRLLSLRVLLLNEEWEKLDRLPMRHVA